MCIIGRSTGYRPDYGKLARNYYELGATSAQLAKLFEVSPAIIDSWIATVPQVAQTVSHAKQDACRVAALGPGRAGVRRAQG